MTDTYTDPGTGLVDTDAIRADLDSQRGPRQTTVEATDLNDPIAKALNSNFDAQQLIDSDVKPFVPPSERHRRRFGPVIPSGYEEQLYAGVKGWHQLVSDDALADAHDVLLQAIGRADEAADVVRGLRGAEAEERRLVEYEAKAAARAGEPLVEVQRADWEQRRVFAETAFHALRTEAQKAATAYTAQASKIDPGKIVAAAEKAKKAKVKHLAAAQRLADDIAAAGHTDALLGEAAAALNIGARWHRSATPSGVSSRSAVAGAQSVVDWLSRGHDVVDWLTDDGTVLPESSRRWLLTEAGSRGWDFLARLESVEEYAISAFTKDHAQQYEGATLTAEEIAALGHRQLPI